MKSVDVSVAFYFTGSSIIWSQIWKRLVLFIWIITSWRTEIEKVEGILKCCAKIVSFYYQDSRM